jgi:hypothetical protein
MAEPADIVFDADDAYVDNYVGLSAFAEGTSAIFEAPRPTVSAPPVVLPAPRPVAIVQEGPVITTGSAAAGSTAVYHTFRWSSAPKRFVNFAERPAPRYDLGYWDRLANEIEAREPPETPAAEPPERAPWSSAFAGMLSRPLKDSVRSLWRPPKKR